MVNAFAYKEVEQVRALNLEQPNQDIMSGTHAAALADSTGRWHPVGIY